MLQPPKQQPTPKLTPVDFAKFFRDKVSTIRSSTAAAPPPAITDRCVPPLSSFEPVSEREIAALLHSSPTKSCRLDPIPTWLLKRLSSCVTPVLCHLCNLSMESGLFPLQLKQACVLPLLKKPTMNPDTCSSYRPISNLSFIICPIAIACSIGQIIKSVCVCVCVCEGVCVCVFRIKRHILLRKKFRFY